MHSAVVVTRINECAFLLEGDCYVCSPLVFAPQSTGIRVTPVQ